MPEKTKLASTKKEPEKTKRASTKKESEKTKGTSAKKEPEKTKGASAKKEPEKTKQASTKKEPEKTKQAFRKEEINKLKNIQKNIELINKIGLPTKDTKQAALNQEKFITELKNYKEKRSRLAEANKKQLSEHYKSNSWIRRALGGKSAQQKIEAVDALITHLENPKKSQFNRKHHKAMTQKTSELYKTVKKYKKLYNDAVKDVKYNKPSQSPTASKH